MHGGRAPGEYEDLILMREANLKPWDLRDPRFSAADRANILACLKGEAMADRANSPSDAPLTFPPPPM